MKFRSLPRTRLRDGPAPGRAIVLYRAGMVQDGGVPTPPPPDVVAPHDHTPNEIESPEELALHLAQGSLVHKTVQGLDLSAEQRAALSTVDVTDALFVGCRFNSVDVVVDLLRRGAVVVPAFLGVPYPTLPAQLYTPEDLAKGFDTGG